MDVATTDFNILEHDIPASSFREHIQDRYEEEKLEASRMFYLASFGEISVEKFRERFKEIYGENPTSLEMDSVREQRSVYETADSSEFEEIKQLIFYIYGSNNLADSEAEEMLDSIRNGTTEELEFAVEDFIEIT